MTPQQTLARYADALATAVSAGATSATLGQPEAQITAPVTGLLRDHLADVGVDGGTIVAETPLPHLRSRPDLGVSAAGRYLGHVELKAPGVGVDPSRFDQRNRRQWVAHKQLPNLLLSDGQSFALFRFGSHVGDALVLPAAVLQDGATALTSSDATALTALLDDFAAWGFDETGAYPSPHRLSDLATLLAPRCRLLRDEIADLATDSNSATYRTYQAWRRWLFGDADREAFADGYAQTIVYALLLGRLDGATPQHTGRGELGTLAAACVDVLRDNQGLLAAVLAELADRRQPRRQELDGTVSMIESIMRGVVAGRIAGDARGELWLSFYEDFLAAYDRELRNARGVYYTPVEVVTCQVRLISDLLAHELGKTGGFGDPDVIALDPACGTGTYPLAIINQARAETTARLGPGAVRDLARLLDKNLIAFELLGRPLRSRAPAHQPRTDRPRRRPLRQRTRSGLPRRHARIAQPAPPGSADRDGRSRGGGARGSPQGEGRAARHGLRRQSALRASDP